MDAKGTFGAPETVWIAGNKFADNSTINGAPERDRVTLPGAPERDRVTLPASGLWLIPGVFDAHTHLTWNDFHEEDRAARTPLQRQLQTREALWRTLRAGITSARDAGGASAKLREQLASGSVAGPRLQVSGDLVRPADAGAGFRAAILARLDAGAQWVKLMATSGVSEPRLKAGPGATAGPGQPSEPNEPGGPGTPSEPNEPGGPGTPSEPNEPGGPGTPGPLIASNFTPAEFAFAATAAAQYGARLMVHAWGGPAIDYAIEYGAASIEHGIYLTRSQAERAAAAGLTFVPTLTIYRLLGDLIGAGQVRGIPPARIAEVVGSHGAAVRTAYEVGLPLALGSDFSTPQQHGTNLREIASLITAGIPAAQALLAATSNGAHLVRDDEGGRIAPGWRADAVLLSEDPTNPATFENPDAVAAVIQAGQVVHLGSRHALTAPEPTSAFTPSRNH